MRHIVASGASLAWDPVALPDVLAPDLRAVFTGTAPARPAAGHYYAGRGNVFWQLLHAAGLTPRLLTPADDAALPRHGLGLTDLHRADDGFLVEAFVRRIARYRPLVVAFTSATAANAFAAAAGVRRLGRAPWGPAPWDVAGRAGFVLPGPSGANNGMALSVRIALWRDLADYLETF
jgi:TDG/mug DNA glycosylase family protein